MAVYHFSKLAKNDLEGIWVHTVKSWSEAQAESYIQQIDAAIQYYQLNQNLVREYITKKGVVYNKILVKSHVVFFRIVNGQFFITRILHQSMDLDAHL